MRVSVSTSIVNSRNLNSINDALISGVSKAAMLVQGSAKNKAPVDSGTLRQSIRADKAKIQGENVTATVSTNLEYAPYVEFGTGSRGQSTNTNTEVEVSYRSDWRGNKAQPFLWPALRENRNNSIKIIREEVRKAVK
ncbi:MAG: HK97 gp10 family phage protein [bacterium]|nr:HK97 gp10 family phage protein [bacterium]